MRAKINTHNISQATTLQYEYVVHEHVDVFFIYFLVTVILDVINHKFKIRAKTFHPAESIYMKCKTVQ